MTKNFCDICGVPASKTLMPEFTLKFEDRKWSGTKCEGVNPTDGTWSPSFQVRAVFDGRNISKEDYKLKQPPDLCNACMIMILNKLIQKISAQ